MAAMEKHKKPAHKNSFKKKFNGKKKLYNNSTPEPSSSHGTNNSSNISDENTRRMRNRDRIDYLEKR